MNRSIVSAAAVAGSIALAFSAFATVLSAAQASSQYAKPFDVYVDRPTGFAFINAPQGWTFVRKLDAQQMRHLHATTLVRAKPAAPVIANVASR